MSEPVRDRLLEHARSLAERCPPELGPEIAVTGSVSKGFADADSDIEFNCWTPMPVDEAAVRRWLAECGVERVYADPDPGVDMLWLEFRWRGAWFEAGWQTFHAAERTIDEILAGQRLGHGDMMLADVVAHAIPLRSEGRLAAWQARLAAYPEALRRAIIERELTAKSYPQRLDGRWIAARRGHWLALSHELRSDVMTCLRLLFALEGRWEPDWKWLLQLTGGLKVRPPDLLPRIERIFGHPSPEERVATAQRLLLDTFALLPRSPLVDDARQAVLRSLETRGRS